MDSPHATIAFHHLESGSYSDDLPLWRDLAHEAGPRARVLDLGGGTGRVSLDLARSGHRTWNVDLDAVLLDEARLLAAEAGLEDVHVLHRDVVELADDGPGERFGLAVLAQSFVQLMPSGAAARTLLRACALLATDDGRVAVEISEDLAPHEEPSDVRERTGRDGRRYTSRVLACRAEHGRLVLHRERTVTGPDGATQRALACTDSFHPMRAEDVAALAAEAGLLPEEVIDIDASSDGHVAGTVVVLRRA